VASHSNDSQLEPNLAVQSHITSTVHFRQFVIVTSSTSFFGKAKLQVSIDEAETVANDYIAIL